MTPPKSPPQPAVSVERAPEAITYNPVYQVTYEGADPTRGYVYRLAAAKTDGPSTPAAEWRAKGEPDPHGSSYDCERARLCGGHLTDDQVAYQTAMLMRNDLNHEAVLTTAKDRIRWLSRKLEGALALRPADGREMGV